MKFVYNKICICLLHVNNNVYTFLSGIAISLATNIFTTICIDEYKFDVQWNLYLSTACFTLVSVVLLYVATEISGFQNFAFNSVDNFNKEQRRGIIREATEDAYKKWIGLYMLLLVSLMFGIAFMAIDCSNMVICIDGIRHF